MSLALTAGHNKHLFHSLPARRPYLPPSLTAWQALLTYSLIAAVSCQAYSQH